QHVCSLTSMARQCYFNVFSEKQLLCKGDLRMIGFSTPISKEQRQELEEKYLCQTHYNHKVVNKNHYQQNNENLKVLAIVYTIDKEHISHNMYWAITKIKQDLPKEWAVSKIKQQIDNQMRQAIPIRTINLDINISQTTNSEINENVDINDPEIVEEVTKSIGKAAYRSLRDVLFYIIPSLIQKGVLQLSNPTLHIRISGDGRNVGKKVNHVMVTFALLNDLSTIYYSEKHYTLLIYPGIKKYETLKTVLSPLIQELNEIQSGYLDNEGCQWNICLYFLADWKFLAICLEHKAANAEDFCL
ncbi:36392_t:CDS:2, partial [Gigaspora margarita]